MSGLFGGGGTTISTVDPIAAGLRIQTSAYGLALPLVYGRTRIPGNLMWYGDFTPIAHTETTSSGGGGKGGGGEVSSSHTTYTYTAAFALGLGEGPFTAIHAFWRDKDFVADASSVFTIKLGTYPQTVWSHLSSNHPAEAVPYQGVAYVCASAYDLGSSDYLQNHSFEVTGRLPHQVGVIDDANPKDILSDVLINAHYGCGFPAGKLGSWTQFSNYCVANGIFFSPCYSEQAPANEVVAKLTDLANTAPYFSEGQLKCVPLGDAQVTGNGVTYVPNVTPLYDLTDDDYLDDDEPVRLIRKTPADAWNHVQVEYANRANQYNFEPAEAKDQTAIDVFGLLTAEPIVAHEIARTEVARAVAQIKLQRALFIRNEYEFRVGWKFSLVEPTDILTLTDATLGLDKVPVRVLTVEESEDGGFLMTAEDFPAGTTSAATYATQGGGGYTLNTYIAPGPVNTPAIFEPPNGLTAPDLEVWVAVSGTVPEWGGCDVWVSEDNATYRNIGRVVNPARHGTLSSILATGSDPDVTNTLAVDLSPCRGALVSVSQADADDGNSLLWVDGELISYQNATLTTQYHYNLTYLRRGRNGTAIGAHAAGTKFARLDEAIFKYVVPRELIGRPIWIKFTSFNVFGNATEQLADVTAYSYTILGNRPAGLASLSATGGMFLNQIGWTFAQNQYDRDFIEIWGGTTNNRNAATLLTSQKDPTTSWKHPGLPAAQQWFYWGRVVDTSGNQSDFFPASPTNGVPATTSSDAAEMLDLLQGQLTLAELAPELANPIGNMATSYVMVADANGKITGMRLGADAEGSTNIVMLADKLTFVQPDGSGTPQPILTVGTINGQPALGFAGHLLAADGSFSGQLLAATGVFTGALSAATGTFAGQLLAATGVFAGSLQAATGTFAGSLQAATGTFAGSLAAGVVDASAFDVIREEKSAAGTYNIVVPALKAGWSSMKMRITLQGAGGGGGGGSNGSIWDGEGWQSFFGGGGGGGKGSKTVYDEIDCTPGQTVSVTIGDGGAPGVSGYDGNSTSGADGAETSVIHASVNYPVTSGKGGGRCTSSAVGAGGVTGGGSGSASMYSGVGGNGASSPYGVGGQGGYVGSSGPVPGVSGGLGSGGGGGGSSSNYLAQPAKGGQGYALIEFYDPNTIVLNSRYSNLITWLDSIGHGAVPASAR